MSVLQMPFGLSYARIRSGAVRGWIGTRTRIREQTKRCGADENPNPKSAEIHVLPSVQVWV